MSSIAMGWVGVDTHLGMIIAGSRSTRFAASAYPIDWLSRPTGELSS